MSGMQITQTHWSPVQIILSHLGVRVDPHLDSGALLSPLYSGTEQCFLRNKLPLAYFMKPMNCISLHHVVQNSYIKGCFFAIHFYIMPRIVQQVTEANLFG